MNGIALGPLLILIVAAGGVMLLMRHVLRRRRRGGIVAAGLVFLMGLAMFGVLLPRTAYSRARVERARAVAMREQAVQAARIGQKSIKQSPPHAMDPDLPEEPGSEDDEDRSEDFIDVHAESAIEELNNQVNEEVDAINSKVEATVKGVEVRAIRPIPPVPPRKIDKKSSRSGLPYRSTRDGIITGILLLGVVLAGYFFLNANTRGHYTWRLRIGSTMVFVASLAVILLICR